MPPKQQQQLEKVAWQWAETTEPSDVTQEHVELAYRLGLPVCKQGSCRRNCRGNPRCLNCLGEREWFREIADSTWHDIEDPEAERRKEGAFVGLKNLGATCYVNTFIQVWFHNLTFRLAIYQSLDLEQEPVAAFQPVDKCLLKSSVPDAVCGTPSLLPVNKDTNAATKSENVHHGSDATNSLPLYGPEPRPGTSVPMATMEDDKDLMPNTVCGHLQLLFGLLQFSNRRYIDPTQFINCLGLDVGQQQDAQEFSKLFMSVLEEQLSRQSAAKFGETGVSIGNLVQDQLYRQSAAKFGVTGVPIGNLVQDQLYRQSAAKFGETGVPIGNLVQDQSVAKFGETGVRIGHLLQDQSATKFGETGVPIGNLLQDQSATKFGETGIPIGNLVQDQSATKFGETGVQIGNLLQDQSATKFGETGVQIGNLLQDQSATKFGETGVLIGNLVQDQFQGQYNYITECSHCGAVSQRPSQFYELDLNIKGHKGLEDCIEEFLQEEKLDGDNQYFCAACNSKQNATRRIKLRSLPKVLNLQLLRFVFDRKTGHKKKLNTYIQFPELLDLSNYLGKEDGSNVYELSAVLIHRGPSAYSGHYIAHIKDERCQSWYKFNDEDVDKIGGRDLQLGSEDDIEGKGAKKPRATKGFHASRNAYMLVYQQLESATKVPVEVPTFEMMPERVQLYVQMDQLRFNRWVDDMLQMREKNVQSGQARQQEVQDVYKMMASTPGELSEWISTEWVSKWLLANTDNYVPIIDNGPLLCSHGSLHPDKLNKAKFISADAAEIVYTKYGGGPRLKGSDVLCRTCIVERCQIIRTKARLAEDQKVISTVLKTLNTTEDTIEDGFWVGKASLRSWRRLALEKLESLEQKNGHIGNDGTEDIKEGQLASEVVTCPKENSVGDNDGPTSDDERLFFNEDLLCELHGQLDVESGRRRLVPRDIWVRLRTYFSHAPEFHQSSPVCGKCLSAMEEEERVRNTSKAVAMEQKSALGDLYHNKNRPAWSDKTKELNIISRDFLESWRRFIKEPTRLDAVSEVVNAALLCPHGGFISDPEMIGTSSTTDRFECIWPLEWAVLTKILAFDIEIRVTRIVEDSGQVTVLVSPDLCTECYQARQEAELQAQFHYTNANIYIRKLTTDMKTILPTGVLSKGQVALAGQENSDQSDPEFIDSQSGGKRKKSPSNGTSPLPEKAAKVDGGVRRSSRHRTMRGEKMFTVSARQTLWDLKLQLMKPFSAAPMDQHLFLNGEEICGEKSSLSDLKITPGAVVYLRVDEPCDDPMFMEDAAKASKPEEGFKGTGLLSNQN